MTASFSSGDPVVDRRLDWARALLAEGQGRDACALLHEALQTCPAWAAGWTELGRMAQDSGDTGLARQAFQAALALDPRDPFGAGVYLDRLRDVPLQQSLPVAFVETLFDQFAPSFDQQLTGALGYRGPEALRDAVLRTGHSRFGQVLDLGCGTGLMGAAIRPFCDWLGGVDLSSEMLKRAGAKGLYDALEQGDIGRLELRPEAFDLIVASDVFNYLGALDQVLGWCRASLRPGGWLAFTVEKGDAALALPETNRFTHSADYVTGLLAQAGFGAVTLTEEVLRHDRGAKVMSLLVTAQAAPVWRRQSDGEEDCVAA